MKHPPDSTAQRTVFLREMAGLWPCIKGSLAEVRKPFTRAGCPACRSGRRHPAHILSFHSGGKVHCRYVPREWVAALRQAIANGRRVEQRLAERSGELLERYRRQRTEAMRAHVGRTQSAQ